MGTQHTLRYNDDHSRLEGTLLDVPQHIGVIAHPYRTSTHTVAEHIVDTLQQRGLRTWLSTNQDDSTLPPMEEQLQDTDMIIAIGGDGTMLRAARTCASFSIPVLGVNMGYLGFLPEVNSPDDWEAYINRLMTGDYWVERRMMLDAIVTRDEEVMAAGSALNDVVINRNRAVGTVLLQTYIDGYWATTYHADALVMATPTGSTAYALAAGGPILPPELHNILIVPVAPHLSMDRPLVLSEGATVQVIVSPEREHDVIVVTDGGILHEMRPGDRVDIRASKAQGLFVRMREKNYFYRSLLDRLEPRVPSRATPKVFQLPVNVNSNEL